MNCLKLEVRLLKLLSFQYQLFRLVQFIQQRNKVYVHCEDSGTLADDSIKFSYFFATFRSIRTTSLIDIIGSFGSS